jgi:hypothetical protein
MACKAAAPVGNVAKCGRTIKLTHECRPTNSRIANPHSAALIACSAWFGNVGLLVCQMRLGAASR